MPKSTVPVLSSIFFIGALLASVGCGSDSSSNAATGGASGSAGAKSGAAGSSHGGSPGAAGSSGTGTVGGRSGSGNAGSSALGDGGDGGESGSATGGIGGAGELGGSGGAGGKAGAAGTGGKGGGGGAAGSGGTGGTSGAAGSSGTGGTSGAAGSGGTGGTSGAAGSGGTSGSGGAAGSGGGFNCTSPSLVGVTALAVVAHAATPFPAGTGTGGVFVSGTYFDTTVDVYQGGATPAHTHEVIIIDATTGELREADDGGNAGATHVSLLSYTLSSSTMLTFNAICGGTGTVSGEYSASPTHFSFFDAQHGRVETFTKQ